MNGRIPTQLSRMTSEDMAFLLMLPEGIRSPGEEDHLLFIRTNAAGWGGLTLR